MTTRFMPEQGPGALGTPQARRVAVWLWLGIVGNAGVLVIYFSSRSIGLPIGPDTKTVEAWGGLDLVCAVEEILLVVIAAPRDYRRFARRTPVMAVLRWPFGAHDRARRRR